MVQHDGYFVTDVLKKIIIRVMSHETAVKWTNFMKDSKDYFDDIGYGELAEDFQSKIDEQENNTDVEIVNAFNDFITDWKRNWRDMRKDEDIGGYYNRIECFYETL